MSEQLGRHIGPAAQGVALAAAGLFAGASLFVSAVEVPAALKTGTSHMYAYFPHMYRRAAVLQGTLAALASHSALIAAAKADTSDKLGWRAAGLLIGAVWPWTLFAMMPINKTIIKQDEKNEGAQEALVKKWASLHWVRTGLSCASLAVMLATVLKSRSSSS